MVTLSSDKCILESKPDIGTVNSEAGRKPKKDMQHAAQIIKSSDRDRSSCNLIVYSTSAIIGSFPGVLMPLQSRLTCI